MPEGKRYDHVEHRKVVLHYDVGANIPDVGANHDHQDAEDKRIERVLRRILTRDGGQR